MRKQERVSCVAKARIGPSVNLVIKCKAEHALRLQNVRVAAIWLRGNIDSENTNSLLNRIAQEVAITKRHAKFVAALIENVSNLSGINSVNGQSEKSQRVRKTGRIAEAVQRAGNSKITKWKKQIILANG